MTETNRPYIAFVGLTAIFLVAALIAGVMQPVGRHHRPHPEPVPVPTPVDPFSATAHALLATHNTERAKHGKPPLVLNERLCRSAEKHAQRMAAVGYLSHQRAGDGDPFSRIEREGFRFSRAAENIAWNQRDEAEVTRDWMSDFGHRANVLGRYTSMGAAVAYGKHHDPYWCVDFGTPLGDGEEFVGRTATGSPTGSEPPIVKVRGGYLPAWPASMPEAGDDGTFSGHLR